MSARCFLSVCLFVLVSVCPCVCLSVCLFVRVSDLSASLFICFSVSLSPETGCELCFMLLAHEYGGERNMRTEGIKMGEFETEEEVVKDDESEEAVDKEETDGYNEE